MTAPGHPPGSAIMAPTPPTWRRWSTTRGRSWIPSTSRRARAGHWPLTSSAMMPTCDPRGRRPPGVPTAATPAGVASSARAAATTTRATPPACRPRRRRCQARAARGAARRRISATMSRIAWYGQATPARSLGQATAPAAAARWPAA